MSDMSSRSFYNSNGAPFLYTGVEQVGPGMDCLQARQPAGPFHYLISEQAKSLVALQELQNEVGALLEFRDLVMDTFPNLRNKLASSTPATMSSHASNIPVSIRGADWTPGRVKKKLNSKDEARCKKGGDFAVQDSGFSTEASSKETHSASSTAPVTSTAAGVGDSTDEVEDELWNLLDVIHRKGTRLKDEVEALQGTFRERNNLSGEDSFQQGDFQVSADDIREIRKHRDELLVQVKEMQAEVEARRDYTSRLQEDLEYLLETKHDLEEQLKAVVTQKSEVNSRIHDLHLQFVTRNIVDGVDKDKKGRKDTASQRTRRSDSTALDRVLGDAIPKVSVPDSKKFAAILKEKDPLVLQKHLLCCTVQNQVLQQQLDTANKLKDKLEKAKEENEELRFQLVDKNIELEGTRARMRLLENSQKPLVTASSPDIIPMLNSSSDHNLSRTEISPPSMKAMSPLPLNLQMDHTSSTESAHDQAENHRKSTESAKKRPSKIPLKSYSAPKPPGGKSNNTPTSARSRSGESPSRPHSAQSWRNRSEGNSLNASKSNPSLPKSRNSSLVSGRDSLSNKLRSSDSLTKLSPQNNTNFGTLKKNAGHQQQQQGKWSSGAKDAPPEKVNSSLAKGKSPYPWTLSSFDCNSDIPYPDSLDRQESLQHGSVNGSKNFQKAINIWNVGRPVSKYFDSIDTNLTSSLNHQGEELAECDSLERQLSYTSDKK